MSDRKAERSSETPDACVVDTANQFCATAELLLKNVPYIAAPSALRCNAAFAIELFLKSLNSHWVEHVIFDDGESSEFEISTRPNKSSFNAQHDLRKLFDAIPADIQSQLTKAFHHTALAKDTDLRSILCEYSDTFVKERYPFERRGETCSKPIREIVQLAKFFRDAIANFEVVRR